MAKFICYNKDCGLYNKIVEVLKYSITIKGSDSIYLDKERKVLTCAECDHSLILNPKHEGGFTTNVAFFSSRTSEQKKEILKKRANEAFRKNKEGMKEYRDHQDEISTKPM
jgi:hypothetical protein